MTDDDGDVNVMFAVWEAVYWLHCNKFMVDTDECGVHFVDSIKSKFVDEE